MQSNDKLNAMYAYLNSGDIDAANSRALEILEQDAESAPAWYVVGEHNFHNGNYDQAVTSFNCVTYISPNNASGWFRLFESLLLKGDVNNAVTACLNAISLEPSIKHFSSYFRFPAEVKTDQVQKKILRLLLEALVREAKSAEYYLLLSRYYVDILEFEKASNAYLMATACEPDNIQMLREYGRFLYEIGKGEKSATVLTELTEREPHEAGNWLVLGACYARVGNWQRAIEANLRVVALEPDQVAARLNLSMGYLSMGLYEEAADYLKVFVEGRHPDFPPDSIQHLGVVAKYQYCNRYLGYMEPLSEAQKSALVNVEDINNRLSIPITPFLLLPILDSPEIQRSVSKSAMTSSVLKRKVVPHVEKPDGRIRVGWFGSDFYDHATMYLISGVFRLYDSHKFDFRIYDHGIIKDEVTDSLIQQVDEYYFCKGYDDEAIVELARSHELDIAVDLKGYTGGGKTTMFAAGLAPIQIFYLGYPGTSGKDFMDYMIADRITVPEKFREHYSEQIIYMPNSYQPNDPDRLKSWQETKREDWGLDPNAVVFASFNQVYKVSRDEVRVWAKLLAEVKGSQLWFYCSGHENYRSKIKNNVIREFAKCGISAERLVFAYPAPINQHLSRLRHADVFLDAFNVNGHTTVSDALFAGVPVVTKPGKQFAARVGASLVSAAGCGELVASSEDEYYRLALRLANDKSYRGRLKAKLAGVASSELYDASQYVRDLQSMFEKSVLMSKEGRPPQDIWP
jgi:predicted O-linked N-acetylglucosamine transferase (SPINDLY family)